MVNHEQEFGVLAFDHGGGNDPAVGKGAESPFEIRLRSNRYRYSKHAPSGDVVSSSVDHATIANKAVNLTDVVQAAKIVRALQWDRRIAMLVHLWRLYELVESGVNDPVVDRKVVLLMDDDEVNWSIVNHQHIDYEVNITNGNVRSRPETSPYDIGKDLARHVIACMNSFIDATDEGLAHLAGLILLYPLVTIDSEPDPRYTELREAFAVYGPELLASRWLHIEQMCSRVHVSALEAKLTNDRTAMSYLSDWAKYELQGRYVLTPIPLECIFYAPRDNKQRAVSSLATPELFKLGVPGGGERIAQYSLQFVAKAKRKESATAATWRPPPCVTLNSISQAPLAHLSRVISTNGICYDLLSHTRSATNMIVCLYRTATNDRSDACSKRSTLTRRNTSGFNKDPPKYYIYYDEWKVRYDGANFDSLCVTQTMQDQSDPSSFSVDRADNHAYSFDAHNGILFTVAGGKRVLVCVRHTRETTLASQNINILNDVTNEMERIDAGVQQHWLGLENMPMSAFRYRFDDLTKRCTNSPAVQLNEQRIEQRNLDLRDYAVCEDRFRRRASSIRVRGGGNRGKGNNNNTARGQSERAQR